MPNDEWGNPDPNLKPELPPLAPGHVRCQDPLVYFFWIMLRRNSYDSIRGAINEVVGAFRVSGWGGVSLDNKALADVARELATRIRGKQ